MSKYQGTARRAEIPVEKAFERLTNLNALASMMQSAPEELKAQLPPITVTDDSLSFETPQAGNLTFKLVEKVAPTMIRFEAQGSPLPLALVIDLAADGDDASTLAAAIDADIPMMLKPLLGGKLREAADKIGETLMAALNRTSADHPQE